jgi:hypothetical protein
VTATVAIVPQTKDLKSIHRMGEAPTDRRCYLCGTADNLTREHIPPKCLFPKPVPSDLRLHTVPCCYICNNSASQDDEYLRLATSSLFNGNAKAKAAWSRVVESTIPAGRIRDRVSALRESMKPTVVETPMGNIAASQFHIDAEQINRCLVRITKGILFSGHPEVDLKVLDFEITLIDQFKLDLIVSSGLADTFSHWAIGDGVYHNWRAVDRENSARGMMVHLFYEAACWMVKFEPGSGQVTLSGIEDWSSDAPGAVMKSRLEHY